MSEAPQNDPAASMAERMAAVRAARGVNKASVETVEAPAVVLPTAEPAPEAGEDIPAGPTILERAAANQEDKRLAKIAALRAAKLANTDPIGDPLVKVRVLKRGGGLISMGEHINGLGDLTYDAGETPSFPRSIAQALEDRGLVEID